MPFELELDDWEVDDCELDDGVEVADELGVDELFGLEPQAVTARAARTSRTAVQLRGERSLAVFIDAPGSFGPGMWSVRTLRLQTWTPTKALLFRTITLESGGLIDIPSV